MTTQIKAGVIAANAVNSSELASGALSGQNFTGDVTFDTTTLKIDSSNNRVGIGTTSPANTLDVVGGFNLSGNLFVDTNVLATDVTNNRVGIGTTSPDTLLHLNAVQAGSVIRLARQDGSVLANDSLGKIEFYTTDVTNTGVAGYIDVQAEGGAAGGSMIFGTGTAGSASEQVRIAASGNVGIGTTNPTRQLMVQDSSANCFVSVVTGTGNVAGLMLGDTDDETQGRVNYDNSTSSMAFYTADTEKVRIDQNGNVGIGTSSPSELLHLSSAEPVLRFTDSDDGNYHHIFSSSNNFYISADRNDSGSGNLIFRNGGTSERMRIGSDGKVYFGNQNNAASAGYIDKQTSGNYEFKIHASTSTTTNRAITFHNRSDTEAMRIDSSGSIAIGSSTVRRDLSASTSPTLSLEGTFPSLNLRDTSGQGCFYGLNGDTVYLGGHTNTAAMLMFVNGSEKMRIDSAGDVGIGLTSPSAKLHIYDGANATEATAQLKIEGSGYVGHHWLNGTAYYIGQNSNSRQIRMYSGSNEGVGVYLTNGGNSWSSYSDERLKENITDIGSVTEKIKDIRCVTYNRKDVDDENKHETIGFIAQDFVGKFDQVLDESKVSDTDEETRYSIRYTETIPILMKAIQEQQTIIDDLKSRIETLEG